MSLPSVLLCTDDAGRRRQWAEALAESARTFHSVAEAPRDVPIDLLITDGPMPSEPSGQRRISRDDVGVIAIGAAIPSDVSLPADVTPRELQLACRLLAEIVRLRRERREAMHAHQVLERLALTDPLTGLPNRRAWEETLAERASAAARANRSLCLALFDVDNFKRINDEFGHVAGDRVLQLVAQNLAHGVRPEDHVARLGGDEFGLLVADLSAQDAHSVVERVRRRLFIPAGADAPVDVAASAGFAVCEAEPAPAAPDAPTAEALLQAADAALRRAKSEGRNRTVGGALRPS